MEFALSEKTIHYYEEKPGFLTIRFIETQLAEKQFQRDFLEIDFNSTNNVLVCHTGNLADLGAKKVRLLGGTISTGLKKA